ncbi:hypothetical protein Q1695_010806 [Nippostrongylus brasiliensis]|nr:hypothetical protein Q1695_010806 [Nippostrongylus brasiliensis]
MSVCPEGQDVAVTGQSSFQKVVRMTMIIRIWMKNMRTKRKEKARTTDDDNVRLVFDIPTKLEATGSKTKLHKRLLYFSIDETSLIFYLWTLLVFVGCFYNLITIVVMVFEEVQLSFYNTWIKLNLLFDVVFLLDLFVLTRREYVDDGVMMRGVKNMLLNRIKS